MDAPESRVATLHASVQDRLARLAPDQRAAATSPPGPTLCIAPAGSGKTTTLVARAAWLIDGGTPPGAIRAITFNKRAAVEMTERLDAAVAPLGVAAGAVRVRTFHALGREILADAGIATDPIADRAAIIGAVAPWADEASRMRLDTVISRLKVELRVAADVVADDPEAGPTARAYVDYERMLAASGSLDFDDLVLRAIRALDADPPLLTRWRGRCEELLVDEVQDVDRSQLDLALLLAAPSNRIFLVGDDDQSIYGWRLADVRRILSLEGRLPDLRRVDLEVNYRCPRPVVERAVRLVEHNRQRFAKRIRSGPAAGGRLILAPDASDEPIRLERAMRTWPEDGSTRAVLARTNRELLPAVAVALQLGIPFRAPRIDLPIESGSVDHILDLAAQRADAGESALVSLGRVRDAVVDAEDLRIAASLLGWAVRDPPGRDRRRADRPQDGRRRGPGASRRASTRRCGADPCDRALDEGPRVRPRDRHGHGSGSIPECAIGRRCERPRGGLRGGAASGVRRVDAGASDPPVVLRSVRAVPVPAGGLRPGRTRPRDYHGPVSHLPSLGRRGEGWVVAQIVLFWLIVATGIPRTGLVGSASSGNAALGLALIGGGTAFAIRGVRDLRESLHATPLPAGRRQTRGDGGLRPGPPSHLRRPRHGRRRLGACRPRHSRRLALAACLWLFFEAKSRREEIWLTERFPGYPAYRERTHRLMPWLG